MCPTQAFLLFVGEMKRNHLRRFYSITNIRMWTISVSRNTSYHKISQSLEDEICVSGLPVAMEFGNRLGSFAADPPAKFQSDMPILTLNLVVRDVARFYGSTSSLQWRHNERDGVSNHQPHDCLLNGLFRRIQKTSKLRVTGLCEGNSPVTSESPYKGAVTRKMFPFDDVIRVSDIVRGHYFFYISRCCSGVVICWHMSVKPYVI